MVLGSSMLNSFVDLLILVYPLITTSYLPTSMSQCLSSTGCFLAYKASSCIF